MNSRTRVPRASRGSSTSSHAGRPPLLARTLWLLPLAAWLMACQPHWARAPHDAMFQREPKPKLHSRPAAIAPTDWVPTFWYSSFGQIARGLSPGTYLERSHGGPAALDVNDFGQVPDSTWFVNRIGRRRFSLADMRRGPNTSPGPATSRLLVKRGSTGGVTPGFLVEDALGQEWYVKFDHPAFPELTSGAEVVSTKLLYAAGYHVPQNHVVSVNVRAFELTKAATTRDDYNRKVPFTQPQLREALDQLNPSPKGQLRAVFSKVLPGTPLGPFPLSGTRPDDPNDTIAHERRRSLRALWVFYAWLNNTDAKYSNSLDVFVERGRGLGYVQHYLLDFGTALGATPQGPKPIKEGYEHTVDFPAMAGRLATLGIVYPYWATVRRAPQRAVGNFEAHVFDPARWKPVHVNPTFEAADALDTFWAASILAHINPLAIAAAVSTGEYSEHGAAEIITETLIERRNKLLAYAFDGLSTLDSPRFDGQRLVLTDLEVLAGLHTPDAFEYRWLLEWHSGRSKPLAVSAKTQPRPRVSLGPTLQWLARVEGPRLAQHPLFTMTWWRRRRGQHDWGPALKLHLRVLDDLQPIAVGLERALP